MILRCARPRWVATLGLALALAGGAVAQDRQRLAVPGGSLTITQRGTATALAYSAGGRTRRAVLPHDGTTPAGSLNGASLIGAVQGRLLILSTVYASRPGMPNGMCGAGTETIIRVVALDPALRQTFSQRIESCWLTIEPGEVAWDARAHTLRIERTTYSADSVEHTETVYAIGDDGSVQPLRTRRLD